METVKNNLRKNEIFHSKFDPSLGTSESNLFFSNLCKGDKSEHRYKNVYDYFLKNKKKILTDIKKRENNIVECRKVFATQNNLDRSKHNHSQEALNRPK